MSPGLRGVGPAVRSLALALLVVAAGTLADGSEAALGARPGRAVERAREERARDERRAEREARARAARTCPEREAPWIDRGAYASAMERLEVAYRLDVELRWQPARLQVSERIDLCNRGDQALETVVLSVLARGHREARTYDVRVDGRRVRPAYPTRADMTVTLPKPLAPGARVRLDIRFTLKPSDDVDTSLDASLSKDDGLLRVSDWFPVVSDLHGLRLPGDSQATPAATRITLDLVTDRRLAVAAPGRRVRRSSRRLVHTIDGARDLAFVVARRFKVASVTTRDGVRVEAHARKRDDATRLAERARQALQRYHDALGPYPWRRFVLAPTPRRLAGHEYPGIVFVGNGWIEGLEPLDRRFLRGRTIDRWLGADYIVSHEVAHQWFYALVGSHQMREPWIDEAISEWLAHHFYAPERLETCSSARVTRSIWAYPNRPSSPGCNGYTETTYRRGAVMIEGVRRIMGDRRFWRAMRELVADNRLGIITELDVVAAWRRHSRSTRLLDAWLGRFMRPPADAGPSEPREGPGRAR